MRIVVTMTVAVDEVDGDGNTYTMRTTSSTGDNPAFVRDETATLIQRTTNELLRRVQQTYPTLQ